MWGGTDQQLYGIVGAARPFHLASLSQGDRAQSEPGGEVIKLRCHLLRCMRLLMAPFRRADCIEQLPISGITRKTYRARYMPGVTDDQAHERVRDRALRLGSSG